MNRFAADLTVRLKPRGGDVRRSPQLTPNRRVQSRVAVLVHGYNVDLCSACRSYDHFHGKFEKWPAANRWSLIRFFWPGDAAWGPLRFAAYPFKPEMAKKSAESLVAALRRFRGPDGKRTEVTFIGHSLGCRVVVEALQLLVDLETSDQANDLPRIREVCLMAAAVPERVLGKKGDLRQACTRAKHTVVLFSPNDKVLRWAFPAGQAAAYFLGEKSMYRRAVGLYGEPAGISHYRRRLFTKPGKGAGHGDYWSSATAAEDVARYLGDAVRNEIPTQDLESHELTGRAPPQARRIGQRRSLTGFDGLCSSC